MKFIKNNFDLYHLDTDYNKTVLKFVFHNGNDTLILLNVILIVKYYVNIMSYRKVLINNIILRKKTCNECTCNININRSYSLGKKQYE